MFNDSNGAYKIIALIAVLIISTRTPAIFFPQILLYVLYEVYKESKDRKIEYFEPAIFGIYMAVPFGIFHIVDVLGSIFKNSGSSFLITIIIALEIVVSFFLSVFTIKIINGIRYLITGKEPDKLSV
jgi:hypothetical protein